MVTTSPTGLLYLRYKFNESCPCSQKLIASSHLHHYFPSTGIPARLVSSSVVEKSTKPVNSRSVSPRELSFKQVIAKLEIGCGYLGQFSRFTLDACHTHTWAEPLFHIFSISYLGELQLNVSVEHFQVVPYAPEATSF